MTDKWIRDTGLVFALVALFLAYRGSTIALLVAAALVFLVLFFPAALRPLAYFWQRTADVLGFVMNRVFFAIVYFFVITVVGFVKRLLHPDPLMFKLPTARTTAFHNRSVTFAREHFERPY